MRHFLLLPILFITAISFAQTNFDASLIPPSLKNRANATIRNEETVVDLQSSNEVNYAVKKAITILNKNGDNNGGIVLYYDKNTVIKSVKGEIYNEFGKLISKFSQGDFKDESAVQGFSLFEDNRVKHYFPSVNSYPYTIVYQYEIRFKQNLLIPDWIPKPDATTSVEKSRYTVIYQPTDHFRIKTQNYEGKAEEITSAKQSKMIWQVQNLPSIKLEPYSPNKEKYLPSVKIAPQQFTYFSYKGSYSNWQELGKWTFDNLLKNRNTLTPTTVQTIKNLVSNELTDKAKAKKIYQYFQDKTRYISIQVGIGGFQPVPASEVDRLGYGDCKALVNYMQSLLNVVGIESYYCVVEAGNEKISLDPSFASMNQGNHIILCMPLKGDTTWLECTNQQIPFGYLGDFTDDRYVLACTATGGKLLRTPKLAAKDNLQIRHADLTLTKDGSVFGQLKTVFTGAQYTNNEYLVGKSIKEQQRLLKEVYDIDHINFEQISYVLKKDDEPVLTENLAINIANYGALNDDRMFLLLNAFNQKSNVPESKNRTMPVYLNRGFTDLDTIVYQLPENISILNEVNDKYFSNEFGAYQSKTTIEGNKLTYTRKLIINDGTFPAESYHIFSKFISEVNAADHLKLVFNLKK